MSTFSRHLRPAVTDGVHHRPQFGSPPHHEHFTSIELLTARAANSASRSLRAPVNFHRYKFRDTFAVAHHHLGEFETDLIKRCLERRQRRLAATPLARQMTVSFVLMSPSTLTRLKLRLTA